MLPKLCKTVINLAYNFARHVIAVSIEKLPMLALVSMDVTMAKVSCMDSPCLKSDLFRFSAQRPGPQPGQRCTGNRKASRLSFRNFPEG